VQLQNHFTFFGTFSTFTKYLLQYCENYWVYSQTVLQNWLSRNMGSILLPFAALWGQKVIWTCKSSVQYHAYSFSGTACKNRAKITARHTLHSIVRRNSMQRYSWTEYARHTAARHAMRVASMLEHVKQCHDYFKCQFWAISVTYIYVNTMCFTYNA